MVRLMIKMWSCFLAVHLSDLNPDLVREKPDKWLVGKMVTASWELDRMPEGIAPFLEVLGYTTVRMLYLCQNQAWNKKEVYYHGNPTGKK